MQGWEPSLWGTRPRGVEGLEGSADVHVLTRRHSPGVVLRCAGRWRLPHRAFAEVGEVGLAGLGAPGGPGSAHAP